MTSALYAKRVEEIALSAENLVEKGLLKIRSL